MRNTGPFLLTLCLAVSGANAAWAQDWPRFRGPDGAGHAEAPMLPVEFTAEDYAWRTELPGPGHSSPVIRGPAVYVTCLDGDSGLAVVRLDAAEGEVRWTRRVEVDAYRQHRDNSFAGATPAVDADGVYVTYVSGEERFVVAHGHDGALRWRTSVGPFRSHHGAGASTVVVNDLVVVPNESEHDGSSITALDPATGETRWKLARDGSGKAPFSTPLVHRDASGAVQLISTGGAHGITSIDPDRGTVNWQQATGFRERCVGSALVVDGLILQTAGSGGGGKEWITVRPGAPGTATAPTVVPHDPPRALPYVPTPVAVGDRLFLWADNGIVTCIGTAPWKQVWQERVSGATYSSPICVDGKRLYNLDRDGVLHVVAADDEFVPLARIELGEPTQASPAVAGGVLYLRTLRHLIAIGGT